MSVKFKVPLQPTSEMLSAGIDELLANLPGLNGMFEDDQDETQETLEDVVCFMWQAMIGKGGEV